MWEEKNIDWSVFTREEKDIIVKARKIGDIKHITSLILDMTPKKEIELQKIIDALTPATEGFESKVRKEMTAYYKKKGISGPQSPDEEAEWENKLQEEYAEFLSKKQDKEEKRLDALKSKKEPKEPKEEVKVVKEESKEPKEPKENKKGKTK